ncbi:hypothetical protein S40293_10646 [Stachybotrys chartarum IBT 40293]|nr:hypothetical protein S40293_10646 [Stachybotrys chartarum IBT 40293]
MEQGSRIRLPATAAHSDHEHRAPSAKERSNHRSQFQLCFNSVPTSNLRESSASLLATTMYRACFILAGKRVSGAEHGINGTRTGSWHLGPWPNNTTNKLTSDLIVDHGFLIKFSGLLYETPSRPVWLESQLLPSAGAGVYHQHGRWLLSLRWWKHAARPEVEASAAALAVCSLGCLAEAGSWPCLPCPPPCRLPWLQLVAAADLQYQHSLPAGPRATTPLTKVPAAFSRHACHASGARVHSHAIRQSPHSSICLGIVCNGVPNQGPFPPPYPSFTSYKIDLLRPVLNLATPCCRLLCLHLKGERPWFCGHVVARRAETAASVASPLGLKILPSQWAPKKGAVRVTQLLAITDACFAPTWPGNNVPFSQTPPPPLGIIGRRDTECFGPVLAYVSILLAHHWDAQRSTFEASASSLEDVQVEGDTCWHPGQKSVARRPPPLSGLLVDLRLPSDSIRFLVAIAA